MSDEFGWRIFRIMSEFVEGFQFLKGLENTVSFFGSARFPEDEHHYKEARQLGKMLGKAGYTIVTGGGPGIMEAGNRGAVEAGAPSVGLNIQLPKEQRTNPYVKRSVAFHYFFTRKVMLSYAAQAYVFFPGGFGTLDELTELLTLVQTKKIEPIPIILVGKDYWRPFIDWMEKSMLRHHRSIEKKDLEIFRLVSGVQEAYDIIVRAKMCKTGDRACWLEIPGRHTEEDLKKKGGKRSK
jgi:hypothetical protein